MMTWFTLSLNMILIMSMIKLTSNPVKLSMTLMLMSMLMFLWLKLKSAATWFPILYFLIFMGGILIMFMILSSILPNEESKKNKMSLIFTAMGTLMLMKSQTQIWSTSCSPKVIKTYLDSSSTMSFLLASMMTYFILNISMVSSENMPMRTILCYSYKP